MSLNIYLLQIC